MSAPGLDTEFLKGLLEKDVPRRKYEYEPPNSRFKWTEYKDVCASRGCRSPAYMQVDGIPRCGIHTIRMMVDIITALELMIDA